MTDLDLIWGASAIAATIKRTRRATYGMLESGVLPARKVMGRWVAERNELVGFFSQSCREYVARASRSEKESEENGGEDRGNRSGRTNKELIR